MKKLSVIILSFITLSLAFTSCGPSDMEIQGEVKQILLLNSPLVSNTVSNGIVSLSGTVESEEAKTATVELIKAVVGVKTVVDEIKVIIPVPKATPDQILHAAIHQGLIEAGFKDITIEVKDEVVTISGTVKKADHKKVLAVANKFKSKKVVNNLK